MVQGLSQGTLPSSMLQYSGTPIIVSELKVFSHAVFSFNDPKSVICVR
jgi:hypothetical protein